MSKKRMLALVLAAVMSLSSATVALADGESTAPGNEPTAITGAEDGTGDDTTIEPQEPAGEEEKTSETETPVDQPKEQATAGETPETPETPTEPETEVPAATNAVTLDEPAELAALAGDNVLMQDEITNNQLTLDNSYDGKTVVLGENITADIVVNADVTVTIDLAGKTLTNSSDHTITNHGNLTIMDTVGGGVVDNVTHAKSAILNEADGKANLLGGTYDRSAEAGSSPSNNGGNSYYYIHNKGTMEMENVSVPGKSAYSSTVRNDGTLTIEDGTEISGNLIAVKNDSGTLYVKGGTLTSENDQAIQNWNEAHITGGTLDGTVTTWAYKNDAGKTVISGDAVVTKDVRSITYDNSAAVPVVEVNGGTFYGNFYKQAYDSQNSGSHYTELEAGSEEALIIIKKGTFEERPDEEFIEKGAAITIISESKPNQGSSDNDDGGDYFGNETWDEVKDQIAEAEEGDTIKVSATGLPYFPSSVARALKGLDITLEIRKNGVTYEVNGLEIGDIDKIWYEFDELETELLTADADSEASSEADEEAKPIPDTGR